jgi:hypothetical protein
MFDRWQQCPAWTGHPTAQPNMPLAALGPQLYQPRAAVIHRGPLASLCRTSKQYIFARSQPDKASRPSSLYSCQLPVLHRHSHHARSPSIRPLTTEQTTLLVRDQTDALVIKAFLLQHYCIARLLINIYTCIMLTTVIKHMPICRHLWYCTWVKFFTFTKTAVSNYPTACKVCYCLIKTTHSKTFERNAFSKF